MAVHVISIRERKGDSTVTDEAAREEQGAASPPVDGALIRVKATLSCSNCGYKKSFKNQFERKKLDMFVVSVKVMAWAACDCGELMELSLEFEI